jgi:hypothetical protein
MGGGVLCVLDLNAELCRQQGVIYQSVFRIGLKRLIKFDRRLYV